MNAPDKLPIKRMEDYHTHYLGESKDGLLFWGYNTFVFPEGYYGAIDEGWEQYRKEYVILHIFDSEGNYLSTKSWCAGVTAETSEKIIADKLGEMVAELGEVTFKDIEVRIFKTVIDDVVFGLILNDEFESVDLQPSSTISFQEPWDGEYYT